MRAMLHILLIALGLSALVSGSMLMLHPDGSALDAPLRLLDRTPFTDFFWPGAILGGLFGLGSMGASLVLSRGWHYAYSFAQVIGAGQVIWIGFQVYWFPESSMLQPVLATIGLTILVLAEALRRRSNAG